MPERTGYRVAVITASDSASRGLREDLSGPAVAALARRHGFEVVSEALFPDDQALLEKEMASIADGGLADLILTTGGTGLSERDRTPEATLAVAERSVPGIAEAMRAFSLTVTKRGMLSRAQSVIRKKTLIINLPGSPKAARENLSCVIEALGHALSILRGEAGDCAT
jgi:molybdenum cofactor synthesis domain-containing protein